MANAYCLTSDLTDWIDFDSDSIIDNTLIGQLITRASVMINSYCGRNFDMASDLTASARLFNPMLDVSDDARTLFLDHDLASAASDLTILNGDGTTVAGSDCVLLPANDYPAYAIQMKSTSGSWWTWDSDPENAISITGVWTYSTLTPDDIVWAAMRLTQTLYNQRSSTIGSDQAGDVVTAIGTVIKASKMPADIALVLNPYRRVRVGASG